MIHDVLILGAGLTGLIAAMRLREKGAEVKVIERATRPGGLLWTNRQNGVTIDILPHVFFSHSELATSLFCDLAGPTRVFKHKLGVLWHGGFVDYPFQNHVHQLSIEERLIVLEGLLEERIKAHRKPRNLEEFALQTLGRGLVELFFRPYNEKLWLTEAREMDWRWHEKKVRLPAPSEMAASILGLPKPLLPVAPHAEFRYPVRGGIESLVEALVERIGSESLSCSLKVLGVDWKRKVVHTSRGEMHYRQIISTLPLDTMYRLISLHKGKRAARRLRATQVVTVHLVARRVKMPDYHWFYVPDPEISFYRVTRPDTFNPDAAFGMAVLLVECSAGRFATTDLEKTAERVQTELEGLGILPKESVVSKWAFATSPAYPIPHVGRDRDVACLISSLRDAGIISVGRFGSWDLMNMDHCMEAGIAAADEVICSL